MMIRPILNAWLLLVIFSYSGLNAQSSNFVFVDSSANVEGLTSSLNDASGPAWGDFNNDGLQDLYLATFEVNTLYLNNGDGTFSDVSAAAAVNDSSKSKAATWGDLDNDGFLDIYISNDREEPNKLYLNNGDGSFIEIAEAAGVDDTNFAQGGAWADFDKNSTLDFYLLQDDSENRLFSNQGTFSFLDVAPDLGLDSEFAAYGITWLDYNDDNNSDLFVTNCRNFFGPTWTNLLFRNDGDGSFTDVSAETGVDYFGESWGTIAFDFDNDLDMDILVTNTSVSNTFLLYENRDGNGDFADVAAEAGLEDFGGVLAVTSGDYDNDGDIDFLAVGIGDANRLYQNQGDGTFQDITEQVQLPNLTTPRYSGTATADYDNDGFLDFVIADERSRAYLFHNEPPDSIANNNWIQIRLQGFSNNCFGIGAKITAVAQDLRQVRHVIAGSGTYSQDMIPVHFGFGTRTMIDTLTVRWPNGMIDIMLDIEVNQLLEISDGVIPSVEPGDSVPENFTLHQNFPNPFNPSTSISFTLMTRSEPVLRIYNVLGELVREFRPGLLTAGAHEISWDGTDRSGQRVASGIYLYRLQAGNRSLTKKMILNR